MAICVRFEVSGMDAATYDEIIRRLEETGQGAPPGRLYHVCYGDADNLQVIDIYDDPASLGAFGAHLMPILHEMGVVAVPSPLPAHNLIAG